MKGIIFRVLAVLVACGGLVVSIIEKNPLMCFCFLAGGLISYELAVIISNKDK
ncbi:MAG: hypothetical protein K2J83_03330 [Clostridia bacterium]|nr:hypothetical protein [Clostridia bacterium]